MNKIKWCKFGRYSSIGAYYALPHSSKSSWFIFPITERDVDTGDLQYPEYELTHGQMYVTVVKYFQDTFGVDISGIGRRCLPRGRVEKLESGWKIYHGNDTPVELKFQIISEFGFGGNPNYSFEYNDYQSMEATETARLIERLPFMKTLFEKPVITSEG